MIKSLTLINFQIHKKLTIEFEKGYNCILGPNNSGKSSIIRAMYWAFYNSPSGDWMMRINQEGEQQETSVKIVFDDGTVLKRIKGPKTNKYEIDGEEYENFGYSVPSPVRKILKIDRFKTNKAEFALHVGMQDDLPFLVHESSTVRASVIDKLTGMSIVQKSIQSFGKRRLAVGKEIKDVQEDIEENIKLLEGLPDLDHLNKLYSAAKKVEDEHKELEIQLKKLEELYINYFKYKNRFEKTKLIDLNKVTEMAEELEHLKFRLKKLEDLNIDRHNFEKHIKLKPLKKHDFTEVEMKLEEYKRLYAKKQELKNMLGDYKKHEQERREYIKLLKSLQKELDKIYEDNPLCPTCGSQWNGKDK